MSKQVLWPQDLCCRCGNLFIGLLAGVVAGPTEVIRNDLIDHHQGRRRQIFPDRSNAKRKRGHDRQSR